LQDLIDQFEVGIEFIIHDFSLTLRL
jgi:hypothetical protein